MQHIADMLSQIKADVIGFQEVRTLSRQSSLNLVTAYRMDENLPIDGTLPMPSSHKTMMHLIYNLLPEYKWAVFVPMAGFHDGTQEGVAVSFLII